MNLYNVEGSVIIEKSDGYHKLKQNQRNPILDKVRTTRLSCFKTSSSPCMTCANTCTCNASVDQNSYETCASSSAEPVTNRTFCFTDKLRAMSGKYLQSSTSKFLARLYRNQEAPLSESTPNKSSGKRKNSKPKLRSFSYGALPGLEEFQKRNMHQPPCEVKNDLDDEMRLLDCDDTDSGILVTDSNCSSFDSQSRFSGYSETGFERCHGFDENHRGHDYNERILVRLVKNSPNEELGIVIAKKSPPGQGYVIAHIVEGGLAYRCV